MELEPYVRSTSSPCNRKCPCRIWTQCGSYKDVDAMAWRLKKKEYDSLDWYDVFFRVDFFMHDLYVTG